MKIQLFNKKPLHYVIPNSSITKYHKLCSVHVGFVYVLGFFLLRFGVCVYVYVNFVGVVHVCLIMLSALQVYLVLLCVLLAGIALIFSYMCPHSNTMSLQTHM